MNNKIKREMFKKLGVRLIQEGIKMLKVAFSIKTKTIYSGQLKTFLASKGLYKTGFPDGEYWYVDKKTIKDIIKYDWIDKKEYILHRFDCSSFVDVFKGHMKEIYGINAIGIAKHIEWVNPETGKHIGWHRTNFILTEDKGVMEIFLYEPQQDILVKIEKDKKIIIWGKLWKLDSIEF